MTSRCAAFHEGLDRLLNAFLERRVDGAGRFIEHEDQRIKGERPRKGKQLPFAHGKRGAALAQRRVDSRAAAASMKRSAPTRWAAVAHAFFGMSVSPSRMLYSTLRLNRNTSCSTRPMRAPQLVARIDLADRHAVEEDLATSAARKSASAG